MLLKAVAFLLVALKVLTDCGLNSVYIKIYADGDAALTNLFFI